MNSRRSLRLTTFFLIFALFSSSSGDQACENGTYRLQTPHPAEATTESLRDCIQCNSTVPFCSSCHIAVYSTSAAEVNCTECFAGYHPTPDGRNCSRDDRPPAEVPGGGPHVVGVVVGVVVGGVVVVVGLVILVVCLVRSGKCSAAAFRSTTPPPPSLPDPDHLASSYKDNQHSGSGQGRDHRYAKEPGPTSPRVESVQYDGLKVDFGNEGSPYVNCPAGVTSTAANAKRKTKKADEREKEKEDDDDDDVYINSPAQQAPSSSSHRSKASPNPKGPGPMKPKPTRKQKDEGHVKTALEKRDSVFPPDDSPEQVYSNEPDSENEEDYVNADVTQMRAGR